MRIPATAALVIALSGIATGQMMITTTFAGGNGFDGNMFDLVAMPGAAVTILSMDGHFTAVAGMAEIWTRPGTYVGFETTMVGWTQVGATMVTGAGPGAPSPVPIPINVTIPAGATQAFYLHFDGGVDYTNGSVVGAVFASDAFLSVLEGAGGGYFSQTFAPRVVNANIYYQVGPSCSINAPSAGAIVGAIVTLDYDADHLMMLPVDAFFEWSTDGGVTFTPCTPGPGSMNPLLGIPTPAAGLIFDWDSVADSVGSTMVQSTDLRITVLDGTDTATCSVNVDVDNGIPPASCMVALTSPAPVSGIGSFDVTPDSPSSGLVSATVEYSVDGGATYSLATPGPSSSNPMLGIPIMMATTFDWDSTADAVGTTMLVPGVLLRVTVDDGVSPMTGACTTAPFDVDNTSLCPGICGDCNLGGTGPDIVDSLTAAQIAVLLVTPTMAQMGCCDVNSSLTVDVVDALVIAQEAAGLMAILVCP